ncbi:HAD family hydrolase [Candidatus Woesearchaeota archaeon]|nr:HAD family hydrolase [Candidatus Woesearchaeota archaeon]
MKYEAVIFDLDGTLVHTNMSHIHYAFRETLREFGITNPKDEDIDMCWFESNRDEMIREKFRVDSKLFWDKFREYDTPNIREKFTKPYSDIVFIEELRKKKYKTGIVTAAENNIASLEIGMLGEGDFDGIIIAQASNGIKPKPHPHGLESCLNILGVDKSKAMYVGNAKEDVEAAKNADVLDVLLIREDNKYKFSNVNPSVKIYSLYDLKEILGF